MMERSERPISREISCVRPPILPLTDSRSERVFVARGSMAYSAVTQPRPSPLSQRGTPSVREAVHRTRVLPNSIRAEPSACLDQPRVMLIGRSWSGVRPSARMTGTLGDWEVMPFAYRLTRSRPRGRPMQRGPSAPASGSTRQVHVLDPVVAALLERRLAQEKVGVPRGVLQARAGIRVPGVAQDTGHGG